MKIIIAGAGDTGAHLAVSLSAEQQDVVLVSTDASRLSALDARHNILTLHGSPVSPEVLAETGAGGCDLFIGVLPSGSDNIVASLIAKSMGAKRTVARIDSAEYLSPAHSATFAAAGVDTMVFPEQLAAIQIATYLSHSWLRDRYTLHDGEIVVVAVRIPDAAPIAGVRLRDLAGARSRFHVSAIRRADRLIIPRGDDTILPNDIAYFTFTSDVEPYLMHMCGASPTPIRNVMITGGGKMGAALAGMLRQSHRVTLIDPDEQECARLASTLQGVTIVNADYRDLDTLRDEGLADADAFIALTPSDETNIVSSLVARDAGVRRTVAEIEDIQYFSEADSLSIDTVINKKLLTASTIYQLLLDRYLDTPRCLALEDAEVAEIVVGPSSPATRHPVKELRLPEGMTIGALVRDGKGHLVEGNTMIHPADHLVVFSRHGSIPSLQRLFR